MGSVAKSYNCIKLLFLQKFPLTRNEVNRAVGLCKPKNTTTTLHENHYH